MSYGKIISDMLIITAMLEDQIDIVHFFNIKIMPIAFSGDFKAKDSILCQWFKVTTIIIPNIK